MSENRVLPKSDFAAAVNYINNHWEQLQLYTTNGLIPIDNNDVEQLMRQVALGRKNWLHLGSADAGDRAATLLTLVSTAHRNDLDVYAYLKDALTGSMNACGHRVTTVYDNGGRVSARINENAQATTHTYDKVSRELTVTNPLLQTHTRFSMTWTKHSTPSAWCCPMNSVPPPFATGGKRW